MYNVKGPSKIVAKTTRRGISQNVDSFRDLAKNKSFEIEDSEFINGPKPVFQNMPKKVAGSQKQKVSITPQHEEVIKYVNESWNSICNETDFASSCDRASSPSLDQTVAFYEDGACPMLHNFKPFDLESWWGKRLFTYITNSVNAKS